MGYFGKRLKSIRTDKGLRQEDVSRAMGISRQAYARFERLILPPKYETIQKLAAALGCSPEDLFEAPVLPDPDPITKEEAAEAFILADIESALDKINLKGQQKVADYAQDISKIPEYKKR